MPLIIAQTFPLGRFHATRWNQNPFEDRFGEWPPSPWRLLRALLARWFQYQRETSDDDTKIRDELLRSIALELPSYRLPVNTWRGSDIRQYLPTALDRQFKYKKGKLDYSFRNITTSLSVDAYRALPVSEPILWTWANVNLLPGTMRLLNEL